MALTCQQNQQRADDVVDQLRAAGRRAIAVQADSAAPAAVIAAVGRAAGELGRLDILVNNAGAFLLGPIEQLSLDNDPGPGVPGFRINTHAQRERCVQVLGSPSETNLRT